MLIRRICKKAAYMSCMIYKLYSPLISPSIVFKEPCTLSHRYCTVTTKVRCFRRTMPTQNITFSPTVSSMHRFTGVIRSKVEVALFDYLIYTRGMDYNLAEHIIKNAPRFLQYLLTKIDENEQDISNALGKLFRYHPINEFKPFLESLGLTQLEYTSLLPRDLMLLADKDGLFDTFQVLSSYGIARTKIGRIYKESGEILAYKYEVLNKRLKTYEDFGFSKSAVENLIKCCPFLLVGVVQEDFLKVLEKLKRLGIKKDFILENLSENISYNWKWVVDTIGFLETLGYTEKELRKLFESNPSLILRGSGQKLSILISILIKLGFQKNDVHDMFIKCPHVLSPNFGKNIWKVVTFLVNIGMENESISRTVKTHFLVLGSHSIKGPKTFYKSLKVSKIGKNPRLCQIIKDDPMNLITIGSESNLTDAKPSVSQRSNLKNWEKSQKIDFLLKTGYKENSDDMAKALKIFRGRGDQLQERYDCLVNAGIDTKDVSNMIRQSPAVLNQTKDLLEKKIDCLKNTLGYPLDSIVKFPSFFCYDIERINLRVAMYAWLRERNSAKPMLSLSTILACSDARFSKYFVDLHPQGPKIWERLKKSVEAQFCIILCNPFLLKY